MSSMFEVGKTYILHQANSSAHFRAKVVKRTKCRVTFELSDRGSAWCETANVTLSVKKDSNVWGEGGKLEEVCGTATSDLNKLRKHKLFSLSDMEAVQQM